MKKFILSVVLCCSFICGGYWTYSYYNTPNEHSELVLANLEALSHDEIIGDKIPCHSSAKLNPKKAYVDCASCSRIEEWEGYGTESLCTR